MAALLALASFKSRSIRVARVGRIASIDFRNSNIRRESSGGMEWLGVWDCNFSGSEFSNFRA